MIRVMQDLGLIDVVPNPDDARSKLAIITPRGRALHSETVQTLANEISAISPRLDVDAIRTALPALETLRQQLDKARN